MKWPQCKQLKQQAWTHQAPNTVCRAGTLTPRNGCVLIHCQPQECHPDEHHQELPSHHWQHWHSMKICGTNIPSLKGKSTQRKPPQVINHCIELTTELQANNKNIKLAADVFAFKASPFFWHCQRTLSSAPFVPWTTKPSLHSTVFWPDLLDPQCCRLHHHPSSRGPRIWTTHRFHDWQQHHCCSLSSISTCPWCIRI